MSNEKNMETFFLIFGTKPISYYVIEEKDFSKCLPLRPKIGDIDVPFKYGGKEYVGNVINSSSM